MTPRKLGDYGDMDRLLFDLVQLGYSACINGQPRAGQYEYVSSDPLLKLWPALFIYPHLDTDDTGSVYARFTPGHPTPWTLLETYAGDGELTLDLGLVLSDLPEECERWAASWEQLEL